MQTQRGSPPRGTPSYRSGAGRLAPGRCAGPPSVGPRLLARTLGLLLISAALPACSDSDDPAEPLGVLHVSSSVDEFAEGSLAEIDLKGNFTAPLHRARWRQLDGPKVQLTSPKGLKAIAEVGDLDVAVDAELVFELTVEPLVGAVQRRKLAVVVRAVDMLPATGVGRQLGGATTVAAVLETSAGKWALYNVANRLVSEPIPKDAGPGSSLELAGFVQDLELITHLGTPYALLALGEEGIAAVDLSDPGDLQLWKAARVNYRRDGLTWTDFEGEVQHGQSVSGLSGPITALATDGETLWIANEAYGIHATSLENLLCVGGPFLERDRTLWIDHEVFTLAFAGEEPWGGPQGLTLFHGRLFAALGSLGMGIFDAATLEPIGGYNLYTDPLVLEDWYQDAQLATLVQPGFLDPDTGMPSYEQASFEILRVWSGQVDVFTPWTDFEKHGKYYYDAREVAVAHFGHTSIAFIAYGLGGLIAVDITGFDAVDAIGSKLQGRYLGQVPAVPAVEAEELISPSAAPFATIGRVGQLGEAGVNDVLVRGAVVVYSDHAVGLVAVGGAYDPRANWHGPAGTYDNDRNGIPGDHIPPDEFVRSYDMTPSEGSGVEWSLAWMEGPPSLLVSGVPGGQGFALAAANDPYVIVCPHGPEFCIERVDPLGPRSPSGHQPLPPDDPDFTIADVDPAGTAPRASHGTKESHGGPAKGCYGPGLGDYRAVDPRGADGRLVLPPEPGPSPFQVEPTGPRSPGGHVFVPPLQGIDDLLLAAGSGGLHFIDVLDVHDPDPDARVALARKIGSTDQVYAAPQAQTLERFPLGDTQGLGATARHLYVADGLHGVSAWRIVDDEGFALDDLQLVGNTLQGERQVGALHPGPDACNLTLDPDKGEIMALCQAHGMRCVSMKDVEAGLGGAGSPLLMSMGDEDLFEHTIERGALPGFEAQDCAVNVTLDGDFAFVADGYNGFTVYDLTKDPSNLYSGFVAANLNLSDYIDGQVVVMDSALWTTQTIIGPRTYAFVAAGELGIALIDVTHPTRPWPHRFLTFEGYGARAPGNSVMDALVVGEQVFFACGDLGVVGFAARDLLGTVPPTVPPSVKATALVVPMEVERHLPPMGHLRLQDVPGFEDSKGAAFSMAASIVAGRTQLYVAYGEAGVARVDWSDPLSPKLLELAETVGETVSVAISQGRVYAADHAAGLAQFK